jgi:hypothetical protein
MEVLECRPRSGAWWSVKDGGGMHGRHGPKKREGRLVAPRGPAWMRIRVQRERERESSVMNTAGEGGSCQYIHGEHIL